MRSKMTEKAKVLSLIVLLVLVPNLVKGQEFSLANNESTLTVFGTSNIHDWEVVAENQSGSIKFKEIEAGKLESMTINIVAESLKSGKSSMDRNTYKALKTNTYKTISFQLTKLISQVDKGSGVFAISTQGDLTISGVKKSILLDFDIHIIGSSVKLTGKKDIKMTDYNIEPPKALLGTVTTGDELTIKFSTIFK